MTNINTVSGEISLLDFRVQISKLASGKIKASNPLLIKKHGQPVGLFIPPDQIQEYLDWQQKNKLLEVYYSIKPDLISLGSKFLKDKKLDISKLDIDELVATVTKD